MLGGLRGNRYGTNKFEEILKQAQKAGRPETPKEKAAPQTEKTVKP